MKRMVAAAQETGYLSRNIVFVPPRDAMFLPPERVLLICTGSQGEARAALSRIANHTHPDIYLNEGDVVFFSSQVMRDEFDELMTGAGSKLPQAIRDALLELKPEAAAGSELVRRRSQTYSGCVMRRGLGQ